MRLYLARHGIALDAYEDPQRGLSKEGNQKITQLAQHLSKIEMPLKQVFHSGKKRAQQTAEILSKYIAPELSPHQMDGLLPNDDVETMLHIIDSFQEDTLLVGHLPYMAELASRLTDNGPLFQFHPGAILALESGHGPWSVVWFVNPDIMS